MKLQHLAASVRDAGQETLLVAEGGHGDVRADVHQRLRQPPAVAKLLQGIMDQFVPQAPAVVVFVADGKVPPPDPAIQRERVRAAFLLGREDGHFISMGGKPVGLVAEDFFHPRRAVQAGYVVDDAHDVRKVLSRWTAKARRRVRAYTARINRAGDWIGSTSRNSSIGMPWQR